MDSNGNEKHSSENSNVTEVTDKADSSHTFHQVFLVEDNDWASGEHGGDVSDPLNVETQEDSDVISVHSEVNVKIEETDTETSPPVNGTRESSFKETENHIQVEDDETFPLLYPKIEGIKTEAEDEQPSQLSRFEEMRDASDSASSRTWRASVPYPGASWRSLRTAAACKM
ncbi:uncharacterized protein LOC126427032 isoform X4 [Schistocerca serialis cubense]|uniref:uncharacterized protein LOC126427032 isoform X4 n=1 Tax=Schistocerca serialis cubense TaxID=2023355 RepID=UPI00214E2A3F|nr:uncharacterized protein LOC126427032 isoform X4 [Schistocerca serialis cubense]